MTDNPDLHCGRGWLARASDVLTGAEDYLSAVEYAHAAAVIGNGYVQLAAAEREAAAQAFVDERHAAERAEDLERIAANRAEDLERITAADAKVWAHHESEAEAHAAVIEAHKAMTARMQAEKALLDDIGGAALAEGIKRELRAEAEARPHDDEQLAAEAAQFADDVMEMWPPTAARSDEEQRADRHAEITEAEASEAQL